MIWRAYDVNIEVRLSVIQSKYICLLHIFLVSTLFFFHKFMFWNMIVYKTARILLGLFMYFLLSLLYSLLIRWYPTAATWFDGCDFVDGRLFSCSRYATCSCYLPLLHFGALVCYCILLKNWYSRFLQYFRQSHSFISCAFSALYPVAGCFQLLRYPACCHTWGYLFGLPCYLPFALLAPYQLLSSSSLYVILLCLFTAFCLFCRLLEAVP